MFEPKTIHNFIEGTNPQTGQVEIREQFESVGFITNNPELEIHMEELVKKYPHLEWEVSSMKE